MTLRRRLAYAFALTAVSSVAVTVGAIALGMAAELTHPPCAESLGWLLIYSSVSSLCLMIGGVCIAIHTARNIAAPLERLQQAAREIEAGDLTARADPPAECDSEMRGLYCAFNGMADALASGITTREQLLTIARTQLNHSTQAVLSLRRANESD